MNTTPTPPSVIIIGGGPSGLMAAEVIASAGYRVELYDAMPSVGRKFLLAGVGGMNITHAEAHAQLLTRYGQATPWLTPYLDRFSATDLREWIHGLGIETFVGSSGRVFPKDMKAAPLLRSWLHRLRGYGVQIYPRHRWLGWAENGDVIFQTTNDNQIVEHHAQADAVLLALGGASWPRLGADGSWVSILREKSIQVEPLLPSNCGFETQWSDFFQSSFAGVPLQTVNLTTTDCAGRPIVVRGEAMITQYGIEGTSVYALSAHLRDAVLREGVAQLQLDLLPDTSLEKIFTKLEKPRGKNSMSNFLRKQFNLSPIKLALLRELTPPETWQNSLLLAQSIKSLSLLLNAFRPIEEAISTAGGISQHELNPAFMLHKLPSVFCTGEMLDWEAPTGGYLLTGCFATGRAAGLGIIDYLKQQ